MSKDKATPASASTTAGGSTTDHADAECHLVTFVHDIGSEQKHMRSSEANVYGPHASLAHSGRLRLSTSHPLATFTLLHRCIVDMFIYPSTLSPLYFEKSSMSQDTGEALDGSSPTGGLNSMTHPFWGTGDFKLVSSDGVSFKVDSSHLFSAR